MSIDETPGWKQERAQLNQRIEALRDQGICYSCYDLRTGDLFPHQHVIYEDDACKAVLELYPRMPGHTIVLYKPHREDITAMTEEEAARLFPLSVRLAQAIKRGLGAEKVYLNTMCDGPINHVHLQLLPRYTGDRIGSTRFVAPRGALVDGASIAQRICEALEP